LAGRKTFALTQQEIIDLDKHIRALPFKRRMQDAFLAMISERESMKQLNEEDLKLIQRCRYERNTYNKRIVQLQLIQKTEPQKLKKLELNILELSKKTDIDAYFAMHDALNEVLKIKRNQTSEKNITAKVERVLNPEKYNQAPLSKSLRKQQDHIKYFIGSLYLNLLEQSGLERSNSNQDLDRMLDLFKQAQSGAEKNNAFSLDQNRKTDILSAKSLYEMEKLIKQAKEDPRNPFNKA
jgi:hypothetical protein